MLRRALFLSLLAVSLLGCKKRAVEAEPSEEVEAGDAPSVLARCKERGEAFVVGEPGPFGLGEEHALPFSAEVGQGVAFDGGFAVGASFERAGERILAVVTIGLDGRGARLVELEKARGDIGVPRIASEGSRRVAAIVEPSREGRLIRLAKLDGDGAHFGPTHREQRGESLALDLALGDGQGLLAREVDDPRGGRIVVSTFDKAASLGPPRVVTGAETDAESPQLIARPGGFDLAYIARTGQDAPSREDDRFVAEAVGFRAIELLSLDESGKPQGPARAITARDGHVVAFDMAKAEGGAVAFVWREDDGPSGSSGGRVMRALVTPEGVGEAVVLEDERVGGGVPGLRGRWLSVTDPSDVTRLGPLSANFELTGPLEAEEAIENGAVLAAKGDVLLIAKPRGRAIRLSVVGCGGEGT